MERLAAVRRLQQEEHDHMQEQYRRLIENTARSSQVRLGLVGRVKSVASVSFLVHYLLSLFFIIFWQ